MATTKPTPAKGGTFKDPFGKWEDGSVRGASKVLKDAKEARASTTAALNRVQALNAAMGSLSGQEAANAKRLLRVAIKELAEAQKQQRKAGQSTSNLQALQTETAGKLAALRTWMLNTELSVAEKKKAASLKKNLEQVIVNLAKSKAGDVDFKAIEVTLDKIKTQQAALPDELGNKFAATEEALERIRDSQAEARKFLDDHSKMLRQFGRSVLHGLGNLTMKLADRIGYGAFNAGNALRGIGMIGRGLMSAGRGVAKVARGDTYIQRYMAAKRTVKESGDEGGDSLTSKLIDQVKKFGGSNMWFQRRLLRELEKQGRDKKDVSGLGKIGAVLTSILGSISSFFGSGGILKTLASISCWLGPLTTAGKFLMTRAMPVIGAFLGGWKLGGMIYEKYSIQIGDAIDSTIGALKGAYEWVKSKIGGVADWMSGMTWDKAKTGVASAASTAVNAAVSTATDVGSAVMSTGTAAAATVAASPVGQAVGSAVTGAVSAGKAAGSYISQGVSKLSSLVGSVINKGGNVDLDGLDPKFQSSLGSMSQDYFAATGKKLQFNSGYRSNEEQSRLYKSLPAGMAAKPGSSLHNYGMAVDVQSSQVNELKKLGLLDKYGFTRPISKEPWHVQPAGLSLAAAKAGVYSADAPANQSKGTATPSPQTVTTSSPASGKVSGAGALGMQGQGQGRRGGNVAGSKPVGVADIPIHDTSDGLLVALNLGVIG